MFRLIDPDSTEGVTFLTMDLIAMRGN